MNKQEIETLIDKIVVNSFADEIDVYSHEKQTLFANAWNENFAVKDPNGIDGINQAGGQIETVLGCIATLIGTIKTIFEIQKLTKKNKEEPNNVDLPVEFIKGNG
jgi:hypothetical protein